MGTIEEAWSPLAASKPDIVGVFGGYFPGILRANRGQE